MDLCSIYTRSLQNVESLNGTLFVFSSFFSIFKFSIREKREKWKFQSNSLHYISSLIFQPSMHCIFLLEFPIVSMYLLCIEDWSVGDHKTWRDVDYFKSIANKYKKVCKGEAYYNFNSFSRRDNYQTTFILPFVFSASSLGFLVSI